MGHARLVSEARRGFPEIVNAASDTDKLAAIASLSPERQQRFAALDAESRRLFGMAQAWQGERGRLQRVSNGMAQQAARQQWQNWAAHQDAIAAQNIPELARGDGKAMAEAAAEVLREAGYSDAEIRRGWVSDPRAA
jgi:hypothetical protein